MKRETFMKRCLAMLMSVVMVISGLTITEWNVSASDTSGLTDYQSMSWETLLGLPDDLTWVFTGDSITHVANYTGGMMGYVEYMEQRLIEMGRTDDTIINSAISGLNIVDIKNDMENFVTKYNPDVVCIKMGMNNRTRGGGNTLTERVANFKTYYQEVIDGILENGANNGKVPRIVLITTTPRSSDTLLNQDQFDEDTCWTFAKATKEIAETNGLQCVDFVTAFCEEAVKLGDDYIYTFFSDDSDGATHPNEAGQYFMFKVLSEAMGVVDATSPLYQLEYDDLNDYALYPDIKEDSADAADDTAEMNKDMVTLADGTTPIAYVDFDSTSGQFDGTLDSVVDLDALEETDESNPLKLSEVQALEYGYTVVLRAKLLSGPANNGAVLYATSDATKAYGSTSSIMAGVPSKNSTQFYSANRNNGTTINTSGSTTVAASTAISGDGAWHTIAICQGNSSVNMYMDGSQVATISINGLKNTIGAGFAGIAEDAFTAYFGRYINDASAPTASSEYCLKANVDYVQYYGTTLTQAQIQELSGVEATDSETDDTTGIASDDINTAYTKNYVWAIAGAEQMSTLETTNGHRTLLRQIENTLRANGNDSNGWRTMRVIEAAAPGYNVSYLADNYDELLGKFNPNVLILLPEVSEVYESGYEHTQAKLEAYKEDVLALLNKDINVKILITPLPSTNEKINEYITAYANVIREIAEANPQITFIDLNAFAMEEADDDAMMRNWFGTDMKLQPLGALEFAKEIFTELNAQGLGLPANGNYPYWRLSEHTYRESSDVSIFETNYRTDNIAADIENQDGLYVTLDISKILNEYSALKDIEFAWLPYVGCGNYNENIQTISDVTKNDDGTYTFAVPSGDSVITVYGTYNGKTYRFRDLALNVSASADEINTAIASIGTVTKADATLINMLETTVEKNAAVEGIDTDALTAARSAYNELLKPDGVYLDKLSVVGAPAIQLQAGCSEYIVELYQYQRDIQILAEAQDGLTIKVNGAKVASGEYSEGIKVALDETKSVEVSVTDGTNEAVYKVTVKRPAYPDIIVTEVIVNGANYTYTDTSGTSKNEDGYDIIEIYNASGDELDLKDYAIGYKRDITQTTGADITQYPYYFTGNTQAFNGTASYTGINQITKYSATMDENEPDSIKFPADSTMIIWVKYSKNPADEDTRTFETLISSINETSLSIDGEKVLPDTNQIVVAEYPADQAATAIDVKYRASTAYENNSHHFILNNLTAVATSTNSWDERGWLFVLGAGAIADSKGQITEAGDDIISAADYIRALSADNGTSTLFYYNVERGLSIVPNAGSYTASDSRVLYTSQESSYSNYNSLGAIEYWQKPYDLLDEVDPVVTDKTSVDTANNTATVSLTLSDNTDVRYMELNVRKDDETTWATIKKDLVLEAGEANGGVSADITSYDYTYSLSDVTEAVYYYGYIVDGNGNKTEFGSETAPLRNDGCVITSKLYTNVTKFRTTTGLEAPDDIPEGYVFGGWYTDEACTKGNALSESDITTTTAYAKLVPEHVLEVKAQVSANVLNDINTDDSKASLRFITTVDSLNYQKIGFEYEIAGLAEKTTVGSNIVYKKLYAVGETTGNYIEYTPTGAFCTTSEYFKTWTFTEIPSSDFTVGVTIRPYWITIDGTIVYGGTVTKSVQDGVDAEKIGNSVARIGDKYYSTLAAAVADASTIDATTITVLKSIEVDSQIDIASGKNIIIQNEAGKDIKLYRATALGSNYMFNVADGATFEISGASAGSLTVDGRTAEEASNGATEAALGGNSLIYNAGTCKVTNADLQYGVATRGGALYNAGTFTGTNVNIKNHKATVTSGNGGGAIYLESGSVTLDGTGEISGNTSAYQGGAVWANAGATFEATGYTFKENMSRKDGGALRIGGNTTSVGTLRITNCDFIDNVGGTSEVTSTANTNGCGGAVYLTGVVNATIQVTDGATHSFEGNDSSVSGGAIDANTSGEVTISGYTFKDNTSPYGGAIQTRNSVVAQVANCKFESNDATNTTAYNSSSYKYYYGGGAIYHATGTLTVSGSNFTGNTAGVYGGAICLVAGATIMNCNFGQKVVGTDSTSYQDGNTAKLGGAIFQSTGTTEVTSSNFYGNTATNSGSYGGGAICQLAGTLTISGSGEFGGNEATLWQGGAIYANKGTLAVTGYSFNNNTSYGDGGAIRSAGTKLTVKDCDFNDNSAGLVRKSGRGGAIYMTSSSQLELQGTGSFTGNDAYSYGDAIASKSSNSTPFIIEEGSLYTFASGQTVTNSSDTVIDLYE